MTWATSPVSQYDPVWQMPAAMVMIVAVRFIKGLGLEMHILPRF